MSGASWAAPASAMVEGLKSGRGWHLQLHCALLPTKMGRSFFKRIKYLVTIYYDMEEQMVDNEEMQENPNIQVEVEEEETPEPEPEIEPEIEAEKPEKSILKPKKTRSEKQKVAFAKCQEARLKKIKEKKKPVVVPKVVKQKKKKKVMYLPNPQETSSDSETEIVYLPKTKRKKRVKKTKIVYIDSSSSEDESIVEPVEPGTSQFYNDTVSESSSSYYQDYRYV